MLPGPRRRSLGQHAPAKRISASPSPNTRLPESILVSIVANRGLRRLEGGQGVPRVELVLDFESYELLRSELWELTQQYLDARRRDTWYQNTSYCFHWRRPCPYYTICSSKDNPLVIENEYEHRPPHTELSESDNRKPVF